VQQRTLGAGPVALPRTEQASNPAVLALLDSASQQVASGDLERAASTLERALRIDPQDGGIWHDLGALRYQQGQYQQAESLAQRSNALATRDSALQARNWRLIEAVRRATGNALGADEAAARALLLERQ
jgi:Flp pilus assembly protein TadD